MKNVAFKNVRKLIAIMLVSFGAMLVLNSCTKMDEYKEKYVSAGELTYTGKIDSVKVYAGNRRVKIVGILNKDPRVKYYRVYWGGRADSATFQLNSATLGDSIKQIITNVPEGEQTFELVTFDAANNHSISTFQNGTVYGDRYQESILNRPLTTSALNANLQTAITFAGIEAATGAMFTEIRYKKTTDDSATILLPLRTTDTMLVNHQYGTPIIYRTYFLPEAASIDTFFTPYTTYQPVSGAAWINLSTVLVKNSGNPFNRATIDASGRWGTLADWTSNASVKNAGAGLYGGYELRSGIGVISMEAGWGLPAVPNGKIYQVVNLPYAGKWRFSVPVYDLGTAGTKYIVVHNGTDIPDVADVPTKASYFYNFSTMAKEATASIEFTVAAPGPVCIGIAANMPDTGTYFKIKNVILSFYKQ